MFIFNQNIHNESNPYFALIKAIDNDKDIKKFSIHEDCVIIAGGAFEDYPNIIERLTIPSKVIFIGKRAFKNCIYLISIWFAGFAKQGQTGKMKKVSIEEEAFYNCSSLVYILFDYTSVSKIGDRAFNNCENLDNFTIPAGVTEIGYQIFDGCHSLKMITYNGNPSMLSKIDINKNNDILFATQLIFEPIDFIELFGGHLPIWYFFIVVPFFVIGLVMIILAVCHEKKIPVFWYRILYFGGIGIDIFAELLVIPGIIMKVLYKRRKKNWNKIYNKYREYLGL